MSSTKGNISKLSSLLLSSLGQISSLKFRFTFWKASLLLLSGLFSARNRSYVQTVCSWARGRGGNRFKLCKDYLHQVWSVVTHCHTLAPEVRSRNKPWGTVWDSLRSRRLEVVGTRKNGRARRRRACLFSLSPTTSKHLLRRLSMRKLPTHFKEVKIETTTSFPGFSPTRYYEQN